MKKIQVTCGGCGIEYKDEHGNTRHVLKTSEDGPFECQDSEASRLVALGVAEYVEKPCQRKEREGVEAEGHLPKEPPVSGPLEGEEAAICVGEMDEAKLRAMKVKALEQLARSMKLDTGKCSKKDDYISLIVSVGMNEEEDEEPPVLGGADPV